MKGAVQFSQQHQSKSQPEIRIFEIGDSAPQPRIETGQRDGHVRHGEWEPLAFAPLPSHQRGKGEGGGKNQEDISAPKEKGLAPCRPRNVAIDQKIQAFETEERSRKNHEPTALAGRKLVVNFPRYRPQAGVGPLERLDIIEIEIGDFQPPRAVQSDFDDDVVLNGAGKNESVSPGPDKSFRLKKGDFF